jgi:hypothetical protein
MNDLQSHISQLNNVVSHKNGDAFAKQIALPLGAFPPAYKQFTDKIRRLNVISVCENQCSDSNACGIIAFRTMALISLSDGDFATGTSIQSVFFFHSSIFITG